MNREDIWRKAPDGATHYSPALDNSGIFNPVFWRLADGEPKEAWAVMDNGSLHRFRHPTWTSDLFSRLIPRPATWSGDGLPPIGTVCEYDANSNGKEPNWHTVEITYLSDWVIVFRCVKAPTAIESVGVELAKDVYSGLERFFRPIRTPEQIAAEEREKAIVEAMKVMADSGVHCSAEACRQIATAYIEAGYRKVEGGAE